MKLNPWAVPTSKAVAEWDPTAQRWSLTGHAFEGLGRLLTVTGPLGGVTCHDYDALGRRVRSDEGGTTTYFAYGGPNVLFTLAGTTSTDYVYASGLLVLRKSGRSVRYVHADHLGNVRLVTYWQSNQVKTEFKTGKGPSGGWLCFRHRRLWGMNCAQECSVLTGRSAGRALSGDLASIETIVIARRKALQVN